MNQDSELPLNSVRVDGGMTDNKLMLNLQADILGIKLGKSGDTRSRIFSITVFPGKLPGKSSTTALDLE